MAALTACTSWNPEPSTRKGADAFLFLLFLLRRYLLLSLRSPLSLPQNTSHLLRLPCSILLKGFRPETTLFSNTMLETAPEGHNRIYTFRVFLPLFMASSPRRVAILLMIAIVWKLLPL